MRGPGEESFSSANCRGMQQCSISKNHHAVSLSATLMMGVAKCACGAFLLILAPPCCCSGQVHDFWHVLTGCHTNVFGELALKALEFVQVT